MIALTSPGKRLSHNTSLRKAYVFFLFIFDSRFIARASIYDKFTILFRRKQFANAARGVRERYSRVRIETSVMRSAPSVRIMGLPMKFVSFFGGWRLVCDLLLNNIACIPWYKSVQYLFDALLQHRLS